MILPAAEAEVGANEEAEKQRTCASPAAAKSTSPYSTSVCFASISVTIGSTTENVANLTAEKKELLQRV